MWALLKRQIIGVHPWVSPERLRRYAAETIWRYNRRGRKVTPRVDAIFPCVRGHLTYEALVA
ncbi:hypothetical protein [Methylocystis iwaonis]|uniref:hypothetical protein n=1 Tax=Methylocystis iwaonis TaxID=2885079 RepID=UPI003313178D